MPCDQIRTVTVDVGKMDVAILTDGLRSAGQRVLLSGGIVYFDVGMYDPKAGTIQARVGTEEEVAAMVKRSYSRGVVLTTAKKYGWQMKETEPNRWEVVKR